ncbi:MAG: M23 family metallopeptidase [Candidatus Obscuribacterales bacterium]|nr:M23 family metallopeptidase [Candidatus Obscuribacterales bacterium]
MSDKKNKLRLCSPVNVLPLFLMLAIISCAQTLVQAAGETSSEQPKASRTRSYQVFKIVDEKGQAIRPSALLQVDKHLYLLGDQCLYLLPDVAGNAQEEKALCAKTIPVPALKIKGIPVQEFLAFCYWPAHKSIAILDKSGSLFELLPETNKWQLIRANKQTLGSPDPHYISICSDGPHLLLLDPERNQIWRVPAAAKQEKYFKDVLPWRIHAGDPNVTDGVAIAFDGGTYLLRRSGNISIYPANSNGGNGNPKRLNWKPPAGIIPSRMSLAEHSPCYVVERENSRVLAIDKAKGSYRQFIFPSASDLRGLLPGYGGFCVIDGDSLAFRMLAENNNSARPHPRKLDERLLILRIPIKGGHLPRHPGVFPGARRLYRHGVHQGLDFFNDPGAGTHVAVNTPAIAAAAGKVIRADLNYRDMDARQYNKIMSECARSQYCSDANEDLFRGCQVWIDHGNGLVTRYAHLNKARADLKTGMMVEAGETVGYIGYSGTGENQPGLGKHPHLHFEIWLDGHYLGNGLTPAETIALYQKLFAPVTRTKRGH